MTSGVLSPAQNASKSAVSATPQNFLPLRGLRMMAPPGAGVLIEGRARGKRLRYNLKLLYAGLNASAVLRTSAVVRGAAHCKPRDARYRPRSSACRCRPGERRRRTAQPQRGFRSRSAAMLLCPASSGSTSAWRQTPHNVVSLVSKSAVLRRFQRCAEALSSP